MVAMRFATTREAVACAYLDFVLIICRSWLQADKMAKIAALHALCCSSACLFGCVARGQKEA